jgi:hypothetical protein
VIKEKLKRCLFRLLVQKTNIGLPLYRKRVQQVLLSISSKFFTNKPETFFTANPKFFDDASDSK